MRTSTALFLLRAAPIAITAPTATTISPANNPSFMRRDMSFLFLLWAERAAHCGFQRRKSLVIIVDRVHVIALGALHRVLGVRHLEGRAVAEPVAVLGQRSWSRAASRLCACTPMAVKLVLSARKRLSTSLWTWSAWARTDSSASWANSRACCNRSERPNPVNSGSEIVRLAPKRLLGEAEGEGVVGVEHLAPCLGCKLGPRRGQAIGRKAASRPLQRVTRQQRLDRILKDAALRPADRAGQRLTEQQALVARLLGEPAPSRAQRQTGQKRRSWRR